MDCVVPCILYSCQFCSLQEMRELQELEKRFYAFLLHIATHDLSTVLLTPSCRHYLENIMQLLLITSCSHKEISHRKVGFN